MASLISIGTGNLTTAGTWALVDATSLNDTEAANTALTTSYVASTATTPGAITIDGIAVKLASRAASPTGTISVNLRNTTGGADVAGTEVVLNVSDLPLADTTNRNGGWILFKFAAPVLLLAATNYAVQAKTSSSSQVNLFSTATTNWARMLRTTTTQAPVAGDNMHIMGEHTGAGTGNSFVVTMDSTAATDYGAASTSATTPALSISKRGTLTYGITASTNYILRLSGHLTVYASGTLNIGSSGSEMPRNSTAVLEFDCAADGDFGLFMKFGCTANIKGLSRSSGKDIVKCKLNTDEAVNSTSLGIDTDTGWLDNDEIIVASTTRTNTQTEKGALNGNAGASSLTVDGFAGAGGGLAAAHSGTSPVAAEIGLLTRNVKVRSVSSTAMSFANVQNGAVVDVTWTEFRYFGETAVHAGFTIDVAALGSCNFQYNSLYDCEDGGMKIQGNNSAMNVVVSNNIFYNLGSSNASAGITLSLAGAGAIFSDNLIMVIGGANSTTDGCVMVTEFSGSYTNNTIVSANGGGSGTTGLYLTAGSYKNITGTFSGNVIHSGARDGFSIGSAGNSGMLRGTLGSMTIYRNAGFGIRWNRYNTEVLTWDTWTLFGNTTSNFEVQTSFPYLVMRNCVFNSDASFTTTNNINVSGSGAFLFFEAYLIACSLSTTTAATNDINASAAGVCLRVHAFATTFAATNEFTSFTTNPVDSSFIRSQKHDASLANTKTQMLEGVVAAEATIVKVATGYSWKMTPGHATRKLVFPGPGPFDTLKAAVNASSLVTVKVWVLKNAAYAGSAARLVLVGGVIAGIASDVVASYSKTQKAITAASNASPIVITSNSHGYANGDRVLIEGVIGNTAANGIWTVANQTANTFELSGSTGNGAYSSGGTINVFEELSVTGTPSDAGAVEFYVDCDGTAGSIYVDQVTITQ